MTRRLLTLVLLAVAAPALAAPPASRVTPAQKRALASYGRGVDVDMDGNDVPSSLRGALSDRVFADAKVAAEAALDKHGAAFRRGSDDGFVYRSQEDDAIGMSHVRMDQTYRGLPVVGGELIVHMTRDQITGINGRFVPDLGNDVRASVSDSRAADGAIEYVASLGGRDVRVADVGSPVVYAREESADLAIPVLVAYTDDEGPQLDTVYVHGHSGKGLGRDAHVFSAKSRRLYTLNQACISTGNEMPGTLLFNEGGSSSDTAAMGAYNGTGTTYDYYKAIFNRDSYDNAGAMIVSSVHGQFSTGTSCTKNNAAWFDSPYNQMAYGDGDGSQFSNLANGLDVTAHELSHAVCSRTANLTYSKESGALNEANSDILGRSAAFWFGDGSVSTQADWAIGKSVYTPGTSGDALRYMYNPTADGYSTDYYPERLYSGTCTPSGSNDQCGVHGNSGIANLFYYLLSQGGTHPRGKTTVAVTGVGLTVAQQIWYRALSSYMTSSTNFQGARTATASAAADLYGGSCSATWQSVQKAWDAVGVPGTWSCGGGSTYPESAHPYANSFDQTWTYTLAGSPSSINVTFDAQTKVETNYDYIYVMDKNGVNISGSPFTNTTLAGATKNVPGDTVKIRLTSDSSVTYYGFKVTNVTAGSAGDTTAPTVSITAPTSGSTITGATTVSATASDNVGVSKVEFYLDGALQTTDTTSPYSWAWSPTSAQNGTHTLTAKAYDAANNVGTSSSVSVTVSISSSCSPAQLIGNGGFESGNVTWVASASVITNSTGQAAHGGSYKAWMDGYGSTHTDTMYQTVTIPSCATTATLTFWLHVDSAETTTTSAYDTLKVQVRNSSGTVLATLATYSNLNKATGYTQKSFNVVAYKGQTVQIYFVGAEDASLQTSFVVDDVALNTQ